MQQIAATCSIELPWGALDAAHNYEAITGLPYLFYAIAMDEKARDLKKQIN